jgi:hypothetical protein
MAGERGKSGTGGKSATSGKSETSATSETSGTKTSGTKTKRKVERTPAGEPASKELAAKRLRILVVLVAWGALAMYVMAPINAAALIGLAALLSFMYYRAPEGEVKPRRMLGAGAALILAGLATVGTGPHEIGIGLTLLALLVLAFGIHTFGRLGPEETAPRV